MNREILGPAAVFLAYAVPAAVFVVGVPLAKKRFNEYGLMLPWPTKYLFEIAAIWPALFCFAGLAAAAAWYAARYHPRRAGWACVLLLFPAGLLIALAVLGVALPSIELAEGMSK